MNERDAQTHSASGMRCHANENASLKEETKYKRFAE